MSTISAEALGQYLSSRKPGIPTRNGLSTFLVGKSISSEYRFEVEELDFSFCLFSEDESLDEFIEGYRIKSTDDFEELGYKNIWIRYLNREADMEVTELEIEEMPINFRLHKMRTLVFCTAAHYYDEVYTHLTLPEDFIRYFFENQDKLQVAFSNRYKF
nr:hypothetical protein [Cytophagales bacterium]